jgi:aspartate/methionine/tyrosine aminotransferase
VLPSNATYFLTVDIRSLTREDDTTFGRTLTVNGGVTGVPVSAFYAEDPPRHLLRFCFCKRMGVLEEAVARLAKWRKAA